MITMTPSRDEFPDVVKVLVALADSVYDVATTTDTPQLGLVVPEYLHERYLWYRQLNESSPPIEPKMKRSKK